MSADFKDTIEKIKELPLSEQREILKLLDEYEQMQDLELARSKFMPFVRRLWTVDYIEGRHHRAMAKILDSVVKHDLRRVAINLPPRHSKSKLCSTYLPAYYFGHHPRRKIMHLGNGLELMKGFGGDIRDLIMSPEYQEVFPATKVRHDKTAADSWKTTLGGEYLARGVEGKITGKGGDVIILDDVHSEQEAQMAVHNPKIFDKAYDWFVAGPRQRFQPNGALLLVMTRWGKRDIQGRLIQDAINNGSINDWKIFEFPAIMPSGEPLWPEFWAKEELLAIKRDLPVARWNAQYQQKPTSEEGAIVKRDWWRAWDKPLLPHFEYVIQSWDTAFTAKNYSDPSACTTWGVFYNDTPQYDDGLFTKEQKEKLTGQRVANVMLINSYRDRMEYPDLKRRVIQLKRDHNPDTIIVEGRSSGLPIIQDMRAMGIPIEEYTPARGNDKLNRINATADLFKSGYVWYNPGCQLNDETIEEFATFPSGDHDDLMDSGTQALLRLKDGMLIASAMDDYQLYEHPQDSSRRRRPRLY